MTHIPMLLSEPIPKVRCLQCGEEYEYDPVAGWGCLILTDERNAPTVILGVWCSNSCLNEWLNKPQARRSLVSE